MELHLMNSCRLEGQPVVLPPVYIYWMFEEGHYAADCLKGLVVWVLHQYEQPTQIRQMERGTFL